jgi:hypothetical protein
MKMRGRIALRTKHLDLEVVFVGEFLEGRSCRRRLWRRACERPMTAF